jgi:hypothetical protein
VRLLWTANQGLLWEPESIEITAAEGFESLANAGVGRPGVEGIISALWMVEDIQAHFSRSPVEKGGREKGKAAQDRVSQCTAHRLPRTGGHSQDPHTGIDQDQRKQKGADQNCTEQNEIEPELSTAQDTPGQVASRPCLICSVQTAI